MARRLFSALRPFVVLAWAASLISCAGGADGPSPNPVPSVSSISPSSALVGSAGFNMTVNGAKFLSSSVVRWNGADRATTFVSSTQLTAAISAADVGSGGPATGGAALSADGRFIAFGSRATSLVAGDTNGAFDVFVRDTCLGAPQGCVPATIRVSVALDGAQGDQRSDVPRISADGRYVVFHSSATTLAPGGGPVALAVFLARTGRP